MGQELATILLSSGRYPGGEAMNTRSIVLCYLFVSYLSSFAACSGAAEALGGQPREPAVKLRSSDDRIAGGTCTLHTWDALGKLLLSGP